MSWKIFILLIFLSFSNSYFAQEIQPTREQKIESLSNENVNLYFTYFESCVGCKYPPNYIQPQYLIWVKNGTAYLQKFASNNSKEIKISQSKKLIEILKKPEKLKSSNILPVKGYEKGSKNELEYFVSHFTIHNLQFHLKDSVFSKSITNYEIKTKSLEEGIPNVNYEANQKSVLNQILQIVLEEIKKIDNTP